MLNKALLRNIFFSILILVTLFGRSFTGLYILEFRVGEIIIGLCIILSLIFLITPRKFLLKNFEYERLLVFYKLIIISVPVLFILNRPIYTNLYIFKASSYVWVIAFLFIGWFYFSKVNYENNFFHIFYYCLPIIFILQTTYYPKSLSNFFSNFSDKFEYLKAGDVLIIYVITLLIIQKILINNSQYVSIFLNTTALFAPYFLYASKGAFLAAIFFTLLQFNSLKKYFFIFSIENLRKALLSVLIFFVSTFYIYGNFIFEKSIDDDTPLFTTIDVFEGLSAIIDQRNTTETFASLYIENARLYSQDATANWRLQIWQDVLVDLSSSNKIFFGYGYNEIIPAMDDKERRGSDGTNENVHNYFINILARGGIFQLSLFIIFHVLIIRLYYKKYHSLSILKFVIPIFIVALFDTSMESVRFPLLYYSFLGYFLNEDSIYLQ